MLLTVPGAGAVEVELPYRHPIQSRSVALEAHGATVLIDCVSESEPTLLIRPADPEARNSIDLALSEDSEVLSVTQIDSSAERRSITMEFALPADFPLLVRGTDNVVHRNCEIPTGETKVADQPPGTPVGIEGLSFELDESSIVYMGEGGARFSGQNSQISLQNTTGNHVVSTTDGTIHIDTHRGNIELRTSNVTVSIANLKGTVAAELSRGSLGLVASNGQVNCNGETISFNASHHQGSITASGSNNDIVIFDSTTSSLRLTGNSNRITINRGSGNGNAVLDGGSLDLESWTGRFTLQARAGADFNLCGIEGDAMAKLSDGAVGRLDRVTGHTRIQIQDADLELFELKSVELTATASFVTSNEVPELIRCEITDGEFRYSSSTIRGNPEIRLQQAAEAFFEIPTPCRIHLQGPGKKNSGHTVRGCDVRLGNSPAQQLKKTRWQNRRPTNLAFFVSADAKLSVDGFEP